MPLAPHLRETLGAAPGAVEWLEHLQAGRVVYRATASAVPLEWNAKSRTVCVYRTHPLVVSALDDADPDPFPKMILVSAIHTVAANAAPTHAEDSDPAFQARLARHALEQC